MSDVALEIITWLQERPDWLQEMAERWLRTGALTDADIAEIADWLKTPEGQTITNTRAFDSLKSGSASTDELRLVSIGDICGIENLSPRRPLDLGKGNFVVVYGHTGSGKSGYTRILQRACGKPYAKGIISNVFGLPPTERRCSISYQLGGNKETIQWSPTDPAIEQLRPVDLFNEDVATFYLTEEQKVTYTPPLLMLFKEIARGCERVRDLLKKEQEALVSRLPKLPDEYAETKVGVVFRSLSVSTASEKIQRITQWSEDDQKCLDNISQRLKVTDPVAMAQKDRKTKTEIEQLIAKLRTAAEAFGQENIEKLRNARADAQTKRRVATEAGDLDVAKLEGVGSATWLKLWEAARAYSQTAYATKEFPATDGGAVCVLCHQELDPDAQHRLRKFEEFVQGQLEGDAKQAESAYRRALADLPEAMAEPSIQTASAAAGLTDEILIQKLEEYWTQVRQARDLLLQGEADAKADPVPERTDLLESLQQRAAALKAQATQYEKDAQEFDRNRAETKKRELEGRRWTTQQTTAIDQEIKRLSQVAQYENWKNAANSRPVSIKAGELAEKLITKAYIDRFNEELNRLNASRIRVEIVKTRTNRGVALHQLRLKGASTSNVSPDLVLSEGERRVVTLAAFLADVAGKPHAAPLVFDDPVSSLDHEFEWSVAFRLAELAKERQVLVFTHRLSLYGAAEEAAKKIGKDWKKANFEQRYIEAFDGVCGHPADEGVLSANTKKANNILLRRLDEAKKAGQSGGGDAYRLHAQGICTDFRKLLERTIEDDLLNQIIRRHRRSITTDNRLSELPKITNDDCRFLDELMTKYSAFEHSQSPETPARIPEEAELRNDIEELKAWRDEFRNRHMEAADD